MKKIGLALMTALLFSCGQQRGESLLNSDVDRSNFDTFCASYEKFTGDRADAIRYSIDRIKFIAGVSGEKAVGCNGITEKLRAALHEPANPNRGRERFVLRVGARPDRNEPFGYKADPNDAFALEDVEAFGFLNFITDLYLPHGNIKDISPLDSIADLKVLDVRNNQISMVGSTLKSVSKLEYVDISFNKLDSIDGIGGDFSLKFLDVSQNPIKSYAGIEAKKSLEVFISNDGVQKLK